MMNARKEMSSAEQLVELRKARDRYKALADRFREEGDAAAGRFETESDPLIVMQDKLRHERDARRIANAYEKSIANIVASSEAMQLAQTSTPGVRSLAARLIALVVFLVAASAIFLAVAYPGIYRQALAYFPASWNFANQPVPAQRPVIPDAPVIAPPAALAPPPAIEKEQPKPLPPKRALVTAPVAPNKPVIAKPAKPATTPNPANQDEGGFTAKVLQPDGTFKEQHFSAKPRR